MEARARRERSLRQLRPASGSLALGFILRRLRLRHRLRLRFRGGVSVGETMERAIRLYTASYPLEGQPCKNGIFTKTTRETYFDGSWSRSQGLSLHRDAQGVCWMRHMLTNVRIHTYQSVHSQSKVQSSIAIARGMHVRLVSHSLT